MGKKSAIFSVLILGATGIISYNLANSLLTAPIGLAAPTPDAWLEVKIALLIFLAGVLLIDPIKKLSQRYTKSVTWFFGLRIKVPFAIRLPLVVVAIFGFFVFGFWMAADVLGGLNGYGVSFDTHPILPKIYNALDFNALGNFIKTFYHAPTGFEGAEAIFFFSIAMLCTLLIQLDRGIGSALKDTLTLVIAPILIVFELAVWNYATQDMSWHVATFLYIGGSNDHGYRIYSSGQYLLSNWFVFAIAILLVASRLPGLSWSSKFIWSNKKKDIAVKETHSDSTSSR